MKIKKYIILFFLFTSTYFAQEYLALVTYNTSLPMGNLENYTENQYSWKGFGVEGRRFLQKDVSVGISFGWNIWDHKTNSLIELDKGAISGTQIRYVNAFPILVNAHYYIGQRRGTRGYIGMNVGTYAINQRFNMGVYTINNNNWHFGFAPEAGFILPIDDVSLILNVRYNYALSAGTALNGSDDNSYQYLGFNIGLALPH